MSQRLWVAFLLIPALTVGWVLAGDEEKKASDFELKDTGGKTHKLSDYKDKIVVLEWTSIECPVVERHVVRATMKKLAEKYQDQGVVWFAVDSSKQADAEAVAKWRDKQRISYPVLMDPTGKVGREFGAKKTPHMFIVKDSRIVYSGAIDDDQSGSSENPKNYVSQALKEILAGKPVSTSYTKAYGCGVKYAKAKKDIE